MRAALLRAVALPGRRDARRLWGLAALFDGVDFAIDGEDEPAMALLQSLTAATRVEAPGHA